MNSHQTITTKPQPIHTATKQPQINIPIPQTPPSEIASDLFYIIIALAIYRKLTQ
ncbi:MAG: hypothetical protein AAGD25_33115 [Cyanobacteria bacterium P01_F01_bin.150]